jgi:hypothetical protein
MKESVVEIKGGRYRYFYDPETHTTRYLGPLGDSPAISEADFNLIMAGGFISDDAATYITKHRKQTIKDDVFVLDQDEIDEITEFLRDEKHEHLDEWLDFTDSEMGSVHRSGDFVVFIDTDRSHPSQRRIIEIVREWSSTGGYMGRPYVFDKESFRDLARNSPSGIRLELSDISMRADGPYVVFVERNEMLSQADKIIWGDSL